MTDFERISKIGKTDEAHGETYTRFFRVTGKVSQDWIKEHFPARRCNHEYDCCGCWYPGEGHVVGELFGDTIIAQSFSINV